MISNSKERQFGVFLTYVQLILNVLLSVISTPIILSKLGQSEYGLYNLTSSIISYLSLLTLGFGASYIRFYSRYRANNDKEGEQKLNGLYMVVFSVMGLVALALGVVISFNSNFLFNDTYSADDLHTAKILMLLLTFNMAISFPMSVYSSIIASQEKFIYQKLINIGKVIVSPALSIIVLFFGYGSIGMVVMSSIFSLAIDFMNIFYVHVKLKIKFKFGKIDWSLLKEIFVFALFIAINQLIDQLNNQTDKIILGKMMTSSAVAIYAVGTTIHHLYINSSTAINSVFAPKIHKIVNSKSEDTNRQLTDLFIQIGRVQYFILMLILTGFVFFGQYFISIWAGEGYELAYYISITLMIPYTIPLIQNTGIEIQRAKNKHQFRSLVYLAIAISNVVISILLCKPYGIMGVTVATALTNIIGCGIVMNIYYHKKIEIDVISFWKSIARASLGMIVPVATGTLIMCFVKFSNILIYLCFIVIYSLIYLLSIYLLGMNNEEKAFVKNLFKKFSRKKSETPEKKTQVAIMTLIGKSNYGNRLQNYSLQNFLTKNYDVRVSTIKNQNYIGYRSFYKNKFYKFYKFNSDYRSLNLKKRYLKINKFDKLINFDTNFYSINEIQKLNDKYDYFVVGSDQVWRNWNDLKLRNYLLPGIDNNKKISYASSIAKTNLEYSEKYFFKKYLSSFKGISVREQGSVDNLQPLTNSKVNCHIDPVFLTPASEWEKLEKKPQFLAKKDYILECFLCGKNEKYENAINGISQKYNLKRINIFDKALTPFEFIYLIHHSKIIFTDSFHVIVFSIIFKRPVVHMERIDNMSMSLRMQNLEQLFNTKIKTIDSLSENIDESIFDFNINNAEQVINKETERSKAYFDEMFKPSALNNNLDDKDFFCSGCGLCKNICPVGAIDYIKNNEGFIVKKINNKKCIHCGLCTKKCPALKEFNKLQQNNLFMLKRKEIKEDNSSTTGLFSTLAETVISKGGYVFGAKYCKDNNKFVCIDKKEDLHKIRGSKYYQFDISDIYKKIENLLQKNKPILICGTPCQIAGLKQKYQNNENLVLVQLICHGTPPKQMFDRCNQERFGENPNDINFKYHFPTWDNYSVKYSFDKKDQVVKASDDLFMKLYLSDKILNDCCYNCHFVGKDTGADLILGDCWGIKNIDKKFYSGKGVSIVKVNSQKGKVLFDSTAEQFYIKPIAKSKYKFVNINLFNEFHREKNFYQKCELYQTLEDNPNQNLTDYLKHNEKQTNSQSQKKGLIPRIKRTIKKIIKKVCRIR